MKYFLALPILLSFFLSNFVLALNPSCVDINLASKEELEKITGIGPVLAQRIIDARPFSSIDELVKVSGIAEAKLAKIKEQNLACVQSQPEPRLQPQLSPKQESQKEIKGSPQEPEPPKPKIVLSYPENNPVNKETKITLSVSNLKKADYDLKFSIEKEKTLSNIYNEKEDKWQSSHYYLSNLFSGHSFEKTFRLKLREESLNFQGEADILVRIRESGKSNYLEHKEKINITAPERQEEKSPENDQSISTKNLATIGQQISGLVNLSRPLFVALGLAIFSGTIILILKRKLINS